MNHYHFELGQLKTITATDYYQPLLRCDLRIRLDKYLTYEWCLPFTNIECMVDLLQVFLSLLSANHKILSLSKRKYISQASLWLALLNLDKIDKFSKH